uniref:MAM domain containing 2 n=1 Tax=Molossus molossus TaxID=27622 RepID=A0A7J8EEX0_MOLMO|nr:MAM domain containing 2 [Molossus molossus]
MFHIRQRSSNQAITFMWTPPLPSKGRKPCC